jgi:lipopolysaccharide export system protein LptA
MNRKFLLWSLILAAAVSVSAQLVLPGKKGAPRRPTQIESDRAEFDLGTRRAIYLGHVKVDDPDLRLQCEQLTVDLPPEGTPGSGRPNNILAEVNVVIDFSYNQGQPVHATGDRALYHYTVTGAVTNETVTLTGSPYAKVILPQGTNTATEIIYDCVTHKIHAVGAIFISKPNLNGGTDSNASPAKLF